MNLIIDIGNSRNKVFVFENSVLLHQSTFDASSENYFVALFDKFPQLSKCIISSVAIQPEKIKRLIPIPQHFVHIFSRQSKFPIRNTYGSPQTLGIDRLAAAVGAWKRKANTNCLIIDMGTAITLDVLNAQGEFLGGSISPGAHTRFRALNQFTQRLPLIQLEKTTEKIGKNTASAIQLGVQLGIEYEIRGYVDSLKSNYKSLTVFITGGEGFFFAEKFKSAIFAPNLLAEGLNEILEFNS